MDQWMIWRRDLLSSRYIGSMFSYLEAQSMGAQRET